MFVDIPQMRAGAKHSYEAAAGLKEAGKALLPATPVPGTFGGFAAARSFDGAPTQAHTRHVGCLANHVIRLHL
ncbi:DUF2563 family protein [Mycolicibacterium mengxianglii]|uniref:DUF2563 family protein n=1 Tax=Mycolicibacterium mengxianglii TaxID=2736649 RepID=UPI0018D11855